MINRLKSCLELLDIPLKYDKFLEDILIYTVDKNFFLIKEKLAEIDCSVDKGKTAEIYLAILLTCNGWVCDIVGKPGDGGTDLIIRDPRKMDEIQYCIQVRNQKKMLSNDDVVAIINKFKSQSSETYNCKRLKIISINGYTQNIKNYTKYNVSLEKFDFIEELIEAITLDNNLTPKIALFPHNQCALEKILESIKVYNKIALVMPTGTGKGIVVTALINQYFFGKNILILSSSKEGINQFKLNKFSWNTSNVEFMTYQKLLRSYKFDKEKIKNKQIDLIILDEFHRLGAELWGESVNKLLQINKNAIVIGTTATPIRDLENKNMATIMFDNNIAYELTLAESIVKGLLPMPMYVSSLYSIDNYVYKMKSKIQSYCIDNKKDEYLNALVDSKIYWENNSSPPKLIKKYLIDRSIKSGKGIVFCEDIKHLKQMSKKVIEWFEELGLQVFSYKITYKNSQSKNEEVLKNFRNADSKQSIDLLFVVDKANESIHLNQLDFIILLRKTKSKLRYMQQIGRVFNTSTDLNPVIFDFVDNYHELKIECFSIEIKKQIDIFRREAEIDKININNQLVDLQKNIIVESLDFLNKYKELNNKTKLDWYTYYNALKELKEEKNLSVICLPGTYKDKNGLPLGRFCEDQKEAKYNGTLSLEKEKLLDELNFIWSTNDYKFYLNVERLKEFKAKYGHCRVPSTYPDQKLAHFVAWCRKKYRENKLKDREKEILESLGFTWKIKDEEWYVKYNILYTIYQTEHDCNINTDYEYILDGVKIRIGDWLSKQRLAYKTGNLSHEKIKLLENIKIKWDIREDDFYKKYNALKVYKNINGHCNVSKKDKVGNIEIGKFAHNLRRNIKKKLKEEGILKNHNEYEDVIKKICNGSYNKIDFKNKDVLFYKIRLLEEINFIWDCKKYNWNKNFEIAKRCFNEYKASKCKQKYEDKVTGEKIGKWFQRQQQNYRNGNLEEYKFEKLNKIGFISFLNSLEDNN